MAYSSKVTLYGAQSSPNTALRRTQADVADEAAAAFGNRLLLRVDPRDVRRDVNNPTGAKVAHFAAPNRDPMVFSGSGISAEPIAGKYGGKDVFKMTGTGAAGAGTHNDMSIGPKSLNDVTEFSVFGVGHYDASMFSTGTFRPLFAHYRDFNTLESCLTYQVLGGVKSLVAYSDQGDGGNASVNLEATTKIAAGTPFAFLWIVKQATLPRLAVYVNSISDVLMSTGGDTGIPSPETGGIRLFLGHLTADNQQWAGALARAYYVAGDALDTAQNQAFSATLMAQLKALYGIA